jgi:uncharacterized protein involved in response to NO
MGLIIPAMLIRIAKGHTGRKVVFDRRQGRAVAHDRRLPAARRWRRSWLPATLCPVAGAGAACGWLLGFGILACA